MGWLDFFRKKFVANCGHNTLRKDTVSAFGESCKTEIPIVDGKADYCHCCLEKMAIQCAWCGRVIFIGDPLTFYTPLDRDFKIPEYAVVHRKNPLQLVRCLRRNCADFGDDGVGFWYPPGEIIRVASSLKISLRQMSEGKSGTLIINRRDLNGAIKLS